MQRVLVVGGAGALGSAVARRFASAGNWEVASLDRIASKVDVKVDLGAKSAMQTASWEERLRSAHDEIDQWAGGDGLQAVVHVAGGFAMGGFEDGVGPVESMWEMNVQSAFTAAALAATHLGSPGLLVLTGAQAARKAGGTGFAVGYGMSKAATHQLATDFANEYCAMSQRSCKCILPGTIDTPANREAMPDADHATWTSPDVIADRIFGWAQPSSFDASKPQDIQHDLFVEV
ncbi:Dihydropteridine reductase [Hondaea fermentalgiana]|uniref:Dihydropteridine reductase n=1 Tax=Hondaea fermentalgiana TaxID=2315210 RepID=A0A2R5GUU3_9STRA|nr:Dihydropteridine reductase [Hondaea fermentalgiana]|eukprot:GBG34089.1 Dihydropteridine reductase [Hondaea fermentalgiana]